MLQDTQDDARAPELIPGEQGVQSALVELRVLALYVPAGHEVQDADLAESLYEPTGQSVQAGAPSALEVPAGQSEHDVTDDFPVSGFAVPATRLAESHQGTHPALKRNLIG